jgi:hypothetical protein
MLRTDVNESTDAIRFANRGHPADGCRCNLDSAGTQCAARKLYDWADSLGLSRWDCDVGRSGSSSRFAQTVCGSGLIADLRQWSVSWGWLARARVLEESFHSVCFFELRRDQPHLTPNVIDILQLTCVQFVACCIDLQSNDALLDYFPETNADLEVLSNHLFRAIVRHLASPNRSQSCATDSSWTELMLFESWCERQITRSPYAGNGHVLKWCRAGE